MQLYQSIAAFQLVHKDAKNLTILAVRVALAKSLLLDVVVADKGVS
jgi:hypothetical protein